MRNSRRFRLAPLVAACLAFTGARSARADSDQLDDKPRLASGATARIGTSVGSVYGAPSPIPAIGAAVAVGHRFGRFAVEAEYTFLSFQGTTLVSSSLGPVSTDTGIGSGHRLAALARYDVDVIPFGSSAATTSMLAIYVEGGAGVAWNQWDTPGSGDPMQRLVPANTQRTEGLAGFGVMLDHRLREPFGSPKRIGWFLGWRFAMVPHQPMSAAICRGVSCSAAPAMESSSGPMDQSMLFQSSLEFTF